MGISNSQTNSKKEGNIVCPLCQSTDVKEYMYGLYRFKTKEEADKWHESFIEGGDILRAGKYPAYLCKNCGNKFGEKVLKS